MKEQWTKFRRWQQARLLRNWPRTRQRGRFFYVLKTAFFWTVWMTGWTAIMNKYWLERPTSLKISFVFHAIGGIVMGFVFWHQSETQYKKILADADTSASETEQL